MNLDAMETYVKLARLPIRPDRLGVLAPDLEAFFDELENLWSVDLGNEALPLSLEWEPWT